MKLNPAVARLTMPARITKLPIDERGYPVPKFVTWLKHGRPGDCPNYPGCGCGTQSGPHTCEHYEPCRAGEGKPDFRIANQEFLGRAVRQRLCWICGEQLGRYLAFVIGPMCAINRVTAEPPSHLECARFAVQACPFLLHPGRRRNEEGLPEDIQEPAGIGIKRNPGVMLVWMTHIYKPFYAPNGNNVLFRLGEPGSLEFYARGRKATREEIMAAIDSGLPILRQMAETGGPEAVAMLEQMTEQGLKLVPSA
jgi:hypothetical protein